MGGGGGHLASPNSCKLTLALATGDRAPHLARGAACRQAETLAQTTPSVAAVPPGKRVGATGQDERAGEVSAVPDPAGAPPAQRGHLQGLAL